MAKLRICVFVIIASLVTIINVVLQDNVSAWKNIQRLPIFSREMCFTINTSEELESHCQWYFLNYTPSAWENVWLNNIEIFQNNVCETLSRSENLNKTILMTQRLIELQTFGRNRVIEETQGIDNDMSKMIYRQDCIDPRTQKTIIKAEVTHFIEPLIGLLRDPFTICPRLNYSLIPSALYDVANGQSKRFILMSISAPFYIHSSWKDLQNVEDIYVDAKVKNRNIPLWMYQRQKFTEGKNNININDSKNILFDLGSSYFGSWGGDTTAAAGLWFYEYYKRFNAKFDRIIAFEYSPLNQTLAWEQLPDDVFPVYTLINVGVAESGKFNPWTTLTAIARPYDHVVVKLDIDNPTIENGLINQILNDSSVHSLIDEFFFEHDVSAKEMMPYWGTPPSTLKDSYI